VSECKLSEDLLAWSGQNEEEDAFHLSSQRSTSKKKVSQERWKDVAENLPCAPNFLYVS